MGQYYVFIILGEKGVCEDREFIRAWATPHGIKLMEHAYLNTPFMNAIEDLLSPKGMFYKSRVVWAGDYADPEEDGKTLYERTTDSSEKDKDLYMHCSDGEFTYIVNHTKRQYVDKDSLISDIHPLPLLTSEGNGAGGGDYRGLNDSLCGLWARDVISMDSSVPDDYTELVCEFRE